MTTQSPISAPRRVGKTWLFEDGTTLPVVAGGDGPVEEIERVEVPEDITAVEDIAALEDQIVAEFDALDDAESDDLARMSEVAENLAAVRAEASRREAEQAEAEEQRQALRTAVHGEATEGEDSGESETETPAEEATGAAEEQAEDGAEDRELEPVTAAAPEPRAVRTPATARPSHRSAGRRTRTEVPEVSPGVVITAAADVPGYSTGGELSLEDTARAMHARARNLPTTRLGGRAKGLNVAKIQMPFAADEVQRDGMTMEQMDSLFESATQYRNNIDALVAAGGWCAPSQTLYDAFEIEGTDGLIDLPTVPTSRGGLNVPSFTGIGAAAGALWTWTEEDDIDALDPEEGPTKPCLRIPCPTWTDHRLAAEGLCVVHGNLSDRAYPEGTARFIRLVMSAHAHRLSGAKIAQMASTAGGADANAVAVSVTQIPQTDSVGNSLSAVGLQAADYRSQHGMSVNAVLEAVFPVWVREEHRADLAMRLGVDLLSVSNAQVEAYFTARNIRAQYVSDWQALWNGTPRTEWPTDFQFLLYAAGTFVVGTGGEIDLGVVRDSILNAVNDHTAAWSEEFYALVRRGPQARLVTVGLATTGATGCCDVGG